MTRSHAKRHQKCICFTMTDDDLYGECGIVAHNLKENGTRGTSYLQSETKEIKPDANVLALLFVPRWINLVTSATVTN